VKTGRWLFREKFRFLYRGQISNGIEPDRAFDRALTQACRETGYFTDESGFMIWPPPEELLAEAGQIARRVSEQERKRSQRRTFADRLGRLWGRRRSRKS
jgi:hypothetical protein